MLDFQSVKTQSENQQFAQKQGKTLKLPNLFCSCMRDYEDLFSWLPAIQPPLGHFIERASLDA